MEQEDLQMYGSDDRCPPGYTRKRLLGKGGCAAVWLAKGPKGLVALKQVAKSRGQMGSSSENSVRAEVEAASLLANSRLVGMPGYANIVQLHACEETPRDVFCVFELWDAQGCNKAPLRDGQNQCLFSSAPNMGAPFGTEICLRECSPAASLN